MFSMNWFNSFIGRWPELRVVKPSSLSEQRAKSASKESLNNYFVELNKIMLKYDLKDKPQHIYNIDEKGINTQYRPQNVVAGKGYHPQTVMGERTKTVTVIGAGNALGSQIPPYFIFPGQRMLPDLMEGKIYGADGTVTQSGWSNTDVFRTYLQQHFLKYVQGRDESQPILVLYDGHKSHFSIELIEWANMNNIILFVLPPHCSHILQPMDVGCFGPFQIKYNQECQAFSRNQGRVVTKYDVCRLACKAYTAALSPGNLRSAFDKAGIFPLKEPSGMISLLQDKIAPSTLYVNEDFQDTIAESSTNMNNKTEIDTKVVNPTKSVIESEQNNNNRNISTSIEQVEHFFEKVGGDVNKKVTKAKRRNINSVVGGKAITETETVNKIKKYMEESKGSKQKQTTKQKNTASTVSSSRKAMKHSAKKVKKINKPDKLYSPQPGPSHINLLSSSSQLESEEESDSQIPDQDKCCLCKRFYAQSREALQISFTQWASCDICGHWVHLKYCTPVRVVRKNTPFKCPCC